MSSRLLAFVLGTIVFIELLAESAPDGPYSQVTCIEHFVVELETASGPQNAYTCSPNASGKYPLYVYAHGNGESKYDYAPVVERLAQFGFVVAAYESCQDTHDWTPEICDSGRRSYLEALKIIDFFFTNADELQVDVSKAVSVAGHSTGARVALMVAALADSPTYANLIDMPPQYEAAAAKVGAGVSFNPDPMYADNENPSVKGFVGAISKTPFLIFTGTEDDLEDSNSAWLNFQMVSARHKAFVDIEGETHNTVISIQDYAVVSYAALWAQAFVLGNVTAKELIYGNETQSMRRVLSFAEAGGKNTGNGSTGLLLCGAPVDVWPGTDAAQCEGAHLCGSAPGELCCSMEHRGYAGLGGDGCDNSQAMECRQGTCRACGEPGLSPCNIKDIPWADLGADGCINSPPTEREGDICVACGSAVGQKCCKPGYTGGDGCSTSGNLKCNADGKCEHWQTCGRVLGELCCADDEYPGIGGDGCDSSQAMECSQGACKACGEPGLSPCTITRSPWANLGGDGCINSPPTEREGDICVACGSDVGQKCCKPGYTGGDGCSTSGNLKCNDHGMCALWHIDV